MKAKFDAIKVIKEIREIMDKNKGYGQLAQAKYIMDYIRDNHNDNPNDNPEWVELNKDNCDFSSSNITSQPKEEYCKCEKPAEHIGIGYPRYCYCGKPIKPQFKADVSSGNLHAEPMECSFGDFPKKEIKEINIQRTDEIGVMLNKINELVRAINETIQT